MKIYYFAHYYWELHWLYPLYKKLGGELIDPPPSIDTVNAADRLGFKRVKVADASGILILARHGYVHDQLVETFHKNGGKVVVLQHAWDSEDCMRNEPIFQKFDLYCTSSQEDYDMMKPKFGDRVKFTGSPRFDTLYDVKTKPAVRPLKFSYFLANAPVPVAHTKKTVDDYYLKLPNETDYPVVYKNHPGVWMERPVDLQLMDGSLLLADNYEVDRTYRLMKYAKALVTPLSFMVIESSILGVPLILRGMYKGFHMILPRIPRLKNTMKHYEFLSEQVVAIQGYPCDGKNTDRVIKEIKKL